MSALQDRVGGAAPSYSIIVGDILQGGNIQSCRIEEPFLRYWSGVTPVTSRNCAPK